MSASASSGGWVRHAWLVPAALAVVAVGVLSWGAWRDGYDPAWLSGSHGWWRSALGTSQNWTIVATMGLLLASLGAYWWPRRRDRRPIGLVSVVTLVLTAAALGTASYVPCRNHISTTGVTFWILELYVGQPPSMIYQGVGGAARACLGTPPLALQLGQIVGLGATLIGATAVASMLWREPLARLQSRFAYDVTIFTGLSDLTMPLLRHLVQDARRPHAVIVVEPDDKSPLLEEARLTGARVVVGRPDDPHILRPIISAWRGCALSHLYALSGRVADNEAVIEEAARILGRYKPSPDRQAHLVALIDDPRHAVHWRGTHSRSWNVRFEDALSPAETTACGLIAQVLRKNPRHLLVCGDSAFTVPILVELARRAREQAELVKALRIGLEAAPGPVPPDAPSPLPVSDVTLLDLRSRDIKREYLKSAPGTVLGSLPDVIAEQADWRAVLQDKLDAMDVEQARETVVIIAAPPGSGVHEAGRAARLRPETPVFVLAGPGGSADGAIFDLLHPFEPGLLVNGEVPEDTWTRIARHFHECYRLSHPLRPEQQNAARRPWPQLDPFLRQDNILALRSILTAVAKRGRQWVPAHLVPEGSVVELSETELTQIAIDEHKRWVDRRLAAGQSGEKVVPWDQLPTQTRLEETRYLRAQLSQLEAVGYVPVLPAGGPSEAARFERIGLVRASRLTKPLTWTTHAGETMRGQPGDWQVTDDRGNLRTVTDHEFRSSHSAVGDDRWRRVGTYLAWQVSEEVVIRTKEGNVTARAGDWMVEAPTGERWPVENGQFLWSYREMPAALPAPPGQASTPAATSSSTAPAISS